MELMVAGNSFRLLSSKGNEPRGEELSNTGLARVTKAPFNIHSAMGYFEDSGRGRTGAYRGIYGVGWYQSQRYGTQEDQPAWSDFARWFIPSFRICRQNTYRRVFDRGKTCPGRVPSRVRTRGPILSTTGRSNQRSPHGPRKRNSILWSLDQSKTLSPSRASASDLDRPNRPWPKMGHFGLTGEVLAFSLKALLFPFDPGKPNDYSFHDAADLFPLDPGFGTSFEVKTSVKREGMMRAWLHAHYRLPSGRPGGYPSMTKHPDTVQQASRRIKDIQESSRTSSFITKRHVFTPKKSVDQALSGNHQAGPLKTLDVFLALGSIVTSAFTTTLP